MRTPKPSPNTALGLEGLLIVLILLSPRRYSYSIGTRFRARVRFLESANRCQHLQSADWAFQLRAVEDNQIAIHITVDSQAMFDDMDS